ncbi:MAG: hypothetical protein HZB40_16040 [Rhodocyclales bacterium]|nr:hypothetical protein [Rhodocyclales bacterium]
MSSLVPEMRQMLRNGPRIIRDFAKGLDSTEAKEVTDLLVTAARSGRRSDLALQVGDILLAAAAKGMRLIGDVPLTHFAEQMKRVDIETIGMFGALSDDAAQEVAELFASALRHDAPDLLKDGLERMGHEDLWKAYYAGVTYNLVRTVFTGDLTSFRLPELKTAMHARWLFDSFADYTARKSASGGAGRGALEWALQQGDDTLAAQLLHAELGPGWRAMLRAQDERGIYTVTKHHADIYRNLLESGREGGGAGTYIKLHEWASSRGFNSLLQADHMVEQRFFKYFDEAFEDVKDELPAFLVPWNPTVARNFAALGAADFPYVHSVKTAQVDKLIPKGFEGQFTTQEYFYVYQYIYMHNFRFAGRDFRISLVKLFEDVATYRGSKAPLDELPLVAHFPRKPDELYELIRAAHHRLGLTL